MTSCSLPLARFDGVPFSSDTKKVMSIPFMSLRLLLLTCLLLGAFLVSAPSAVLANESEVVGSSQEASQPDWLRKLQGRVSTFELSNGIRVVFYKRDFAPVFSGLIWVKVGGVDETPGTSGLSHFLEHMAFKGSETIGTKSFAEEEPLLGKLEDLGSQLDIIRRQAEADVSNKKLKDQLESIRKDFSDTQRELEDIWEPNEFSRIYKKKGAVGLNAGTSNDYTVYMVSLPKNSWDTWLWMESDRLKNPVFRQFYKEREVIQEERRSRVDDNPGGKLYEALIASAFWSHPNRLPVIGWPSDMRNLTLTKMRELYDTYYRPDNIVISLAGDLDEQTLKEGLERYFGDIPRAETPLPDVYTEDDGLA